MCENEVIGAWKDDVNVFLCMCLIQFWVFDISFEYYWNYVRMRVCGLVGMCLCVYSV